MPRRRRAPAAFLRAFAPAPLALAVLAAVLPHAFAHEEWNHLHIASNARPEYIYPFDGRSPKISAALLNHHATTAPEVLFSLAVDGQPAPPAFNVLPEEGRLVLGPDSYDFTATFAIPVFEGRAGPAPAIGESQDRVFTFTFRLAPGAVSPPGPAQTPAYTETIRVRLTNLGETPSLAGPLPLTGTVRLPADAPASAATSLRAELSTPYSNWFPITLTPLPANPSPTPAAGAAATFSTSVLARADWHLRLSADGHTPQVVPLGHPTDPRTAFDITLAPAPPPEFLFRRILNLTTPTGFTRAAVSETERTLVAFPGQETWPAATDPAAARAQRTAARLYKYRFDGTRLWEHAPGWETWAGDMTPDGRFVAYALAPATTPSAPAPAELKLVLLDGATGNVLWSKIAIPNSATGRQIDALDLAFSPDARVLAVGSASSGTVTLVDRATGNFLWTVPGPATPSFGQIRRLRFSPDSQFLYCGSGDAHVRKLRVTDGVVLWQAHAGGWPHVSGLDLTPEGTWLVAGTRSLDATLIRTSDGQMQWQRETQFPDAVFAPDDRHVATAGGQIYRTLDGSLAGMTKLAAPARFTPDARHVVQFDRTVRFFDLGGQLLATTDPTGLDAPPAWAHVAADGQHLILLARNLPAPNQPALVIFERTATSATNAPRFLTQPLAQTLPPGATATLVATAAGTPPLAYQWFKDDAPVPGARGPTLVLPALAARDAGTYRLRARNALTATDSAPATLQVSPSLPNDPVRLTNLAVRTTVGSSPLIVGFALGGDDTAGTKPLLLRGAGPALATVGVANPLADPRLDLFSGSTPVLANDNWDNNAALATLATQVGAFPFAANSRDAALLALAVSGSYTAQVSASAGTTGSALAEIYDGSPSWTLTTPRLINLSARAEAGPNNLLIAGFVVTGSSAKQILVRAIGPGLAAFRVLNPLANPQLSLFRDGTLIATNDDWHDAPNALALAAATQRVTFPLPPGSADAALLLSLPPGSYTAQVTGPTPGHVLIEVYDIP